MEKEKDFTLDISKLLEESCDLNYNIAKENCKNGIMSDGDCCWYHSVWQYLRLIDKVSSPQWHTDFYRKALGKIQKEDIKVLISGTADYSLLALIYTFAIENNKNVEIYVLDTCKTPLKICEWFAEKHNFTIKVINSSIMNLEEKQLKFDLICTDAFLTRFKAEDAKKIIRIWCNCLNDNGIVATTVRVSHNSSNTQEAELKQQYIIDAMNRFDKKENITLSKEEFRKMVSLYVENMKSNAIGNKDEVDNYFKESGFYINEEISKVNTTSGEYEETKYYEILAQKK